jgi:hypothetical protein
VNKAHRTVRARRKRAAQEELIFEGINERGP